MEDDSAPADQSVWAESRARTIKLYLLDRLSAHTNCSAVFNWRTPPPVVLYLTLWLKQSLFK